jgi:putative ABC transport system substrate-binding protein
LQLEEIRAAALGLNLKLEEIDLYPKGLESVFQTAIGMQVNGIILASATVIFTERKRIVELASKYRLPAVYSDAAFVDEGGLLSYANDRVDQYRRAAFYVDKILRGTKPADLPVERPTKFELVINLKTAKQIGLTIPPNVLARADKVIR